MRAMERVAFSYLEPVRVEYLAVAIEAAGVHGRAARTEVGDKHFT
jgi:hypothetical protein